ncbi:MAG: SURF1 family cytochrome oxidase biogenesis protein [Henriciella sp.]
MSFRPMPLLTVLSGVSLIILVLLGNWQYARYSEKIDAPAFEQQVEARELVRILIDTDHPGYAQQVYGFADSEPIWRRYVPGTLEATSEPVLAMVEATGGAEPVPIRLAELPETATFEGVISRKEPSNSSFASTDDPDANIWYSLNPEQLATKFEMGDTPRVVEPVMMTVRNAVDLSRSRQTLNPYAFAKPLDPLPPERHFGYALTWWGMALGLIGVYVALHRARGRLKFK